MMELIASMTAFLITHHVDVLFYLSYARLEKLLAHIKKLSFVCTTLNSQEIISS